MRASKRKQARSLQRLKTYTSRIEQLEPRRVLSHTVDGDVYDPDVVFEWEAGGQAESSPNPFPDAPFTTLQNGMPVLHSLPGAPAAVFLDFDGDTGGRFGTVQPYDTDGNPAVFGATEQSAIFAQWKATAIYFAMFNVNVTTIHPNISQIDTAWIVIGDNNTTSSGGVSGVNVFPNNRSESVSAEGGGATTFAHEIGHNFGSRHISRYDNLGNKTQEYHTAFNELWAPIMGSGGGVIRKWAHWHSATSVTTLQDDMALIINDLNLSDGSSSDGYRVDDYGGTIGAATPLTPIGNGHAVVGIIERLTDADAFSFSSTGGTYSISVGRDHPSSVDTKLSIYNAAGTLLAAEDGDPRKVPYTLVHNAQVVLNLPAGTYYAIVESHGNYGDQGQYVLRVDPLANGWNATDIGLAGVPGYSNFNSGNSTFTIGGSGSDIWSTRDGLQFMYQTLQGDGTITARVTSVENTHSDAKAGVMIRESLDDNSRNAMMLVKPGGGTQFQRRTSPGASTSNTTGSTGHTWVRLTRSGNTITAFTSTNGSSWTQVGSAQTISMGATVYIGLAVTSHANTVISKATFTNVGFSVGAVLNPQPTSNGLAAPTGLSVTSTTSDSASLSWSSSSIVVTGDTNGDFIVDQTDLNNVKANFGGTGLGDTNGDSIVNLIDYNNVKNNLGATVAGYAIERSSDNITFVQVGTTLPNVTTFVDSGLSNFQRYFYRLRIVNGGGVSTPSSVAMATTKAGAVSDLNVIQVSTSQLVLDWTDASGEANYRVQRSNNGTSGWTTLDTLNKNVPMFVNSNLSAGTQYFYRIQTLEPGGAVTATSSVIAGATLMSGTVANLQFTNVGSNSISFSWNAFSGATGYKVERSTNGGVTSFSVLAANQTSLNFTDNNVNPLSEYYYRVTPLNSFTQAASGLILTGSAPSTPLPSQWQSANIGSTGGLGSAGLNGSTYTVIGGGTEVTTFDESVYFVYQSLSGDGQITARVASLENIDISPGSTGGNNSRAGIMVRDSLTAESREVFLTTSPASGTVWMRRSSNGGILSSSTLNSGTSFSPTWLRITRSGNTFSAEISSNGTTWTTFSQTTNIPMNSTVFVGFAVLAGTSTLLNTSTFTNLTVTAGSSAAGGSSVADSSSSQSTGGEVASLSGDANSSPTGSNKTQTAKSGAKSSANGLSLSRSEAKKIAAIKNLLSGDLGLLSKSTASKLKKLSAKQRDAIDQWFVKAERGKATWRSADAAVDALFASLKADRISRR